MMENFQNQQNNNSNNNDQPLVSLVNLITENLNNPNINNNQLNQNSPKEEINNNIDNNNNIKEEKKEKEKDDILLEIDQIIGKDTIENNFTNPSTNEDSNTSNSNISNNKLEISENHFLKNENNVNYSSSYRYSKETLDEAILTTINRDLNSIYNKLLFVINPFSSDEEKKYHIKQWDLWGPLIFNIFLAGTLAIHSENKGQTIILIFLIFWLGSFLIFINSHLLGVNTSIFQIICLLGYCLFPLNISTFIFCIFRANEIFKFLVIGFTCFWSLFSASSYLSNLANSEQRYLVLYPVILLYLYISWFIFTIKH